MWTWLIIASVASWAFGIGFGLFIGWAVWHPINNLSIEDLRQELDRRLYFEEAEAAERKLRAQMVASGRNEVPRPNAGDPVRISSIRFRRDE